MLSRHVHTALGAAIIVTAGVAAFAVTAPGDGEELSPVVARNNESEGPAPEPSTRPAMRNEVEKPRAECLKDQYSAGHQRLYAPAFVNGPDSPRTPEEAIALADQGAGVVDRRSGAYKENVTYAQVGERRTDQAPRRYVGRSTNGRPRVMHTVIGGAPGGGWVATATTICTDEK